MGNDLLAKARHLPTRLLQRSPFFILAVVCSAMFLDLANLSAVTIALPAIQRDLNVEVAELQWAITAYALTFGGFLLLGGRGSDIFGHRNVLLFGMCFFALFTLISALMPSFIGLVIARAFQGIGAAFTIPPAQAHIAIYFTEPKLKVVALSYWGASGSLGFIVGLILGGVLTEVVGWRWIFWISFVFSGIVIPSAMLVLPWPESKRNDAARSDPTDEESREQRGHSNRALSSVRNRIVRFDVLGICLGIPGLLMLSYALTSANTVGWASGQILGILIGALVLLVLFVWHEHRATVPLMPGRLFKNLSFNLTLVLAVNTYAIRQACTYFLTIQLQAMGNSSLQTSILFIPLGVSALVANTLAGRLVPRLGARTMFIIGWTLCIPGVTLFSFISPSVSYWRFTFPGMILYIAGLGCVYITANFVVVSSATKSDQGIVAGIFNVALQVGGSVLGLAILTAVAQGVDSRYNPGQPASDQFSQIGYQSVYYSCIILCGIGLFLSLFAIKIPDSSSFAPVRTPAALNPTEIPLETLSGAVGVDGEAQDQSFEGSEQTSQLASHKLDNSMLRDHHREDAAAKDSNLTS